MAGQLLHLTAGRGRGNLQGPPVPISGRAIVSDAKLPRVLPRDVSDYRARQAAHLRALAENATTPRLKDRLLKEAERHERLEGTEDENAVRPNE